MTNAGANYNYPIFLSKMNGEIMKFNSLKNTRNFVMFVVFAVLMSCIIYGAYSYYKSIKLSAINEKEKIVAEVINMQMQQARKKLEELAGQKQHAFDLVLNQQVIEADRFEQVLQTIVGRVNFKFINANQTTMIPFMEKSKTSSLRMVEIKQGEVVGYMMMDCGVTKNESYLAMPFVRLNTNGDDKEDFQFTTELRKNSVSHYVADEVCSSDFSERADADNMKEAADSVFYVVDRDTEDPTQEKIKITSDKFGFNKFKVRGDDVVLFDETENDQRIILSCQKKNKNFEYLSLAGESSVSSTKITTTFVKCDDVLATNLACTFEIKRRNAVCKLAGL